jgi:hypothetical protein
VTGWLADLARTPWALLYWNALKTRHRLRPRPGRNAPCQAPSDSGKGGETGCEACLGWNQTRRFHRVCPLVRNDPQRGPLCSVDAAAVRPFWGRALGLWALGLLVVYLTGAAALSGLLRSRGYALGFVDIAWPPAWERFGAAQAQVFWTRGEAAARAGRHGEATLALSLAVEKDPKNHDAALLLAGLWQGAQPQLSNALYARVVADAPALADVAAQRWYLALLTRGDFARAFTVAADRVVRNGEPAAWTQATLFAGRLRPPSSGATPVSEALRRDAPVTARLAELDQRLTMLSPPEARAALLALGGSGEVSDSVRFFRCDRLTRSGLAEEALLLLDGAEAPSDSLVTRSLRLDALAVLARSEERAGEFARLLAAAPRLRALEAAAAHLIRYPEARLADRLFAAADAEPLPSLDGRPPLRAAFYAVAGVHRDARRLPELGRALRDASRLPLSVMAELDAFFLSPAPERPWTTPLPLLQPLPMETFYALVEHLARGGPRPSHERRPGS